MRLYLDASVLAPLFVEEASSGRADARVAGAAVLVSGFGVAEFSAAIARRVRTGDLTSSQQHAAYVAFDSWAASATSIVEETPADMQAANLLVRRQEFALRAPDALHIAISQRIGAALFTLDNRMADAATKLGLSVET